MIKLERKFCVDLKNTVVRNGIIFSFFSFLNSGISFLLLLILARYLSPDEYGSLNLFNTLVLVLSIIISLNSDGLISVEYFRKSFPDLRRIINTIFFITITVFLLLSLVLILFSDILQIGIGLSIYYQWLALLVCFFQLVSTINLNLWRLEEKPFAYGFYSLSIVILNFSLTIGFVVLLNTSWQGRMYSQLISGIIFFLISIIFLIRRKYLILIKPVKLNFKEALSFGIPLIPHGISFWLRQGLDRYIINYFFSSTSVGLFSFASNISNILQIVGTAFNATNSVYIYKNLSKRESEFNIKKTLYKQTIVMFCFFVVVTVLLVLCATILIPILFPFYTNSVIYLFPLCGGAFFQCIYLLFVNYLFYYKKTRTLMYITFSISIIHALLSLMLTRYSIEYTAYINFFSSFLVALMVFLYSRRVYKVI